MKQKKTVFITGCNGTLGKKLVSYFLKKNFNVIGTKRKLDNYHQKSKNLKLFKLDLLKDNDFKKLVNDLNKSNAKIDLLINNAAIPSGSLINYDISRLKKFYLDNGFYDVQIPSASIKIINDLYANIIFSIDSGIRYKLSSIQLVDNSNSLKKENIIFFKEKTNKFLKNYYNKFIIDNSVDDLNIYLSKSNFDLDIKTKTEKISDNEIKLEFK